MTRSPKEITSEATTLSKYYPRSEEFGTWIQGMCCRSLRYEASDSYCCVPQSCRAKNRRILCRDSRPFGCHAMSLAKLFPTFLMIVMPPSRTSKKIWIFSIIDNLVSASVLRLFSLGLRCQFASLPIQNAAFHLAGMNCPKVWRLTGATSNSEESAMVTKIDIGLCVRTYIHARIPTWPTYLPTHRHTHTHTKHTYIYYIRICMCIQNYARTCIHTNIYKHVHMFTCTLRHIHAYTW